MTNVSAACATSTSADCRRERLEALSRSWHARASRASSSFGHSNFPASNDIPGLIAYRALLDKYGLHAGGWHGSMNEAQWDTRVNAAKILGSDYIGSGGIADPGIGSLQATIDSADALNRMGKKAVEAGVGPTYIHNHTGEFDTKYVDEGVLKTAFDILMEETDPRYVAAELDVFWSSDAFNDETGTAERRADQSVGHADQDAAHEGRPRRHGRRGRPTAAAATRSRSAPAWSTSGRSLTAARGKVQYYHQEEDGGTLSGADVSLTNLKGVGTSVVGTVQSNPVSFPSVAAGTAAASNIVPVTLTNAGDAPLSITGVGLATSGNPTNANSMREGESPGDFSIVSSTCAGATLPGAQAPTAGAPGGTRARAS